MTRPWRALQPRRRFSGSTGTPTKVGPIPPSRPLPCLPCPALRSGGGRPGQYCHLRTPGASFFSGEGVAEGLFEELCDLITCFGQQQLGMNAITPPWLSCYVDGCEQRLHTDSPHGGMQEWVAIGGKRTGPEGRGREGDVKAEGRGRCTGGNGSQWA